MKTPHAFIFIGVLVCGIIPGHAPLHAQSPSEPIKIEGEDKPWNQGIPISSREVARNLFLEGNRLFTIPLFTKAAEKYIAALGKWKHPAFYFNLALAQLNLGQQVEARSNLEQALQYGEEPLGPERFKEAQKQLQETERQLGQIRITCSTEGAEVTLDGTRVFIGPGSYQRWVDVRDHEITAKKLDHLSEAKRVIVAPGKISEINLRLITLSEANDASRRWEIWKPWTVITSGILIAGSGGVAHALSFHAFNSYDDNFRTLPCAKNGGCMKQEISTDLNNQLSRARLEQKFAIGGYIAGGSVLVTGAVLLYLNRPRLVEQDAMSPTARAMVVVPTVSNDTLGILVTVSH